MKVQGDYMNFVLTMEDDNLMGCIDELEPYFEDGWELENYERDEITKTLWLTLTKKTA